MSQSERISLRSPPRCESLPSAPLRSLASPVAMQGFFTGPLPEAGSVIMGRLGMRPAVPPADDTAACSDVNAISARVCQPSPGAWTCSPVAWLMRAPANGHSRTSRSPGPWSPERNRPTSPARSAFDRRGPRGSAADHTERRSAPVEPAAPAPPGIRRRHSTTVEDRPLRPASRWPS